MLLFRRFYTVAFLCQNNLVTKTAKTQDLIYYVSTIRSSRS